MTYSTITEPKAIALIGPYQSGKTRLLEKILTTTGDRLDKRREGGKLFGDNSPEAREHGYIYTYEGKGCSICNGTGYKGRVGIYQVMPVSDNIRDAVYAGRNSDEINEIAIADGVKTLRMAALNKVKEGVLTLEECLRTTVGD